jgi:hypothetical protein
MITQISMITQKPRHDILQWALNILEARDDTGTLEVYMRATHMPPLPCLPPSADSITTNVHLICCAGTVKGR